MNNNQQIKLPFSKSPQDFLIYRIMKRKFSDKNVRLKDQANSRTCHKLRLINKIIFKIIQENYTKTNQQLNQLLQIYKKYF